MCQIGLLAGRVNSQGRLGWGEGNPGDLGTIAGEARYRHQPGDSTVGSAQPQKGGDGHGRSHRYARRTRRFSRRLRTSFLILAMQKPRADLCAASGTTYM